MDGQETERSRAIDIDERRECVAWALLHALRVPVTSVDAIVAQGGAASVVERGLTTLPDVDLKRTAHIDRGVVVRAASAFLDAGGRILGGARRNELGRMGRAPSPPLVVYARGNPALLKRAPAVAIVGTRQATPDGRARARALARALSERGVHIVSGGANGIDMEAHQGALVDGTTTAVLGDSLVNGADPRPHRIRSLFVDDEHALAVTPFGPVHADARGQFASRNRFVAALADAIVVVEAGMGSGTFHTAEAAWRMHIPVFTCPIREHVPQHSGVRALLDEQLATPLPDVEALVTLVDARAKESEKELDDNKESAAAPTARRPPHPFFATPSGGHKSKKPRATGETLAFSFVSPGSSPLVFDEHAQSDDPLVRALVDAGGMLERDVLARTLGLDAGALSQRLTLLELDGAIAREGAFIILKHAR
jgi:DNA processing protein